MPQQFTPEDLAYMQANGIDPASVQIVQPQPQQVGKASTIGRTLIAHGGGIVGGGGGAIAGAEGGALLGAPLGPVGVAAGGIIGGIAGAGVGGLIGQKAQEAIEPTAMYAAQQQAAQEAAEQNPKTALATDIIGSAIASGGRPSMDALRAGGYLLGKVGKATMEEGAEEAGKKALIGTLMNAGVNPAINTGIGLATGQGLPSGSDLAAQVAGGALFSRQANWAAKLTGHGEPAPEVTNGDTTTKTEEKPVGDMVTPYTKVDDKGNYTLGDKSIKSIFLKQFAEPVKSITDPIAKGEAQTRNELLRNLHPDDMREQLHRASMADKAREIVGATDLDAGLHNAEDDSSVKLPWEEPAQEVTNSPRAAKTSDIIAESNLTQRPPIEDSPATPQPKTRPSDALVSQNTLRITKDSMLPSDIGRQEVKPSSSVEGDLEAKAEAAPTNDEPPTEHELIAEQFERAGNRNAAPSDKPKFIGTQKGQGNIPDTDYYNLTKPIMNEDGSVKHGVGSTVSEHTLRKHGIDFDEKGVKFNDFGYEKPNAAQVTLATAIHEGSKPGKSPVTLGGALRFLVNNGHPMSSVFRDMLNSRNTKLNTPIVHDPSLNEYDAQGVHRQTDTGSEIALPTDSLLHVPTILHEGIHALEHAVLPFAGEGTRGMAYLDYLQKFIANPSSNPHAVEMVKAYLESAKQEGIWTKLFGKNGTAGDDPTQGIATQKAGANYGFSNVHEFSAHKFDPEFQAKLKGQKWGDTTVWKRIVSSLQKFLGIHDGTMFDRLMQASKKVQRSGKEKTNDYITRQSQNKVERSNKFLINGAELVKDPTKLGLKPNSSGAYNGTQLLGTLMNKLSPAEQEIYKKEGIEQYFGGRTISQSDAVKWMEEHSPKAEVHTYGMEGKVSEAKKEYDKMTHEWETKYGAGKKPYPVIGAEDGKHYYIYDKDNRTVTLPQEDVADAAKYYKLKKAVDAEVDNKLRATSYYSSVSAYLAKAAKHVKNAYTGLAGMFRANPRMMEIPLENEYLGRKPEDYVMTLPDGKYQVNPNPHVGPNDSIHPGPVYNSKAEAIKYAQQLHEHLQILDKLEEHGIRPKWAKSTQEALKSGTELPSNVQRVDVVIPKRVVSYEQWLKHLDESVEEKGYHKDTPENRALYAKYAQRANDTISGKSTATEVSQNAATLEKTLWHPDNLHENLPNTLGWAMIQYKTGPKGEKIAVIAEAQSRWGQSMREQKAKIAANKYGDWDAERNVANQDHPLLRDYNRLILKAAIEQARKEGATHIMVSDAETAMMTEGHDMSPHALGAARAGEKAEPTQASGMRLNYDTILPKIAEELTGSKGERVSLGEHKNALTDPTTYSPEARQQAKDLFGDESERYRDNLIFRNADGTPKTDVSGRLYPIHEVPDREPMLYGKRYAPPKEETSRTPHELSLPPDKYMGKIGTAFRSVIDKVRDIGTPSAKLLGDSATQATNKESELKGRWKNAIVQSGENLNKVQKDRIMAAFNHEMATKTSGMALLKSSAERQFYAKARSLLNDSGKYRLAIGEPVTEAKVLNGKTIYTKRNLIQDEHYFPGMANQKVQQVYRNNIDHAAIEKLDKEFHDYNTKTLGLSEHASQERINNYKTSLQGSIKNSDVSHQDYFNAHRKAQGTPLPPSFRETDPVRNLERYFDRAAIDASHYEFMEKNHKVLAALGQEKDAWNNKIVPGKGVSSLANNPAVKALLEHWKGEPVSPAEGNESSLSSLVSSAFISGPALELHKTVSNIVKTLSLSSNPAVLTKAVTHAMFGINSGYQHAVENGVVKLTARSVSQLLSGSSTGAERMQAMARIIRKVSTLNDLTTKVSTGLVQSMNEVIIPSKIERAAAGDITAQKFLKNLDPTYNPRKVYTPEEVQQLASRSASYIHGTGDIRSMPAWMLNDSEFSGFFSLAHWSIAQTNNFMKDVYEPATRGDVKPLLTSLFGAAIGGYLIKELRQDIQGKKSTIPSLTEIGASDKGLDGNKGLVAYNMIAAMQFSGFGGLLSQVAKYPFDAAYKNSPQGATFPMDEVASDLAKTLHQVSTAIANDPNVNWVDLARAVTMHTLSTNFQLSRIAINQGINNGFITGLPAEKKILSDKMGQLRRFDMVEGLPYNEIDEASNPYMNIEQKNFKMEQDPQKAMQQLPSLVSNIMETYHDNPDVMMSKLKALKENSYSTFPSMEQMPLSFMKYVGYLQRMEGPEAAQSEMMDYMKHKIVNEAKGSVVP